MTGLPRCLLPATVLLPLAFANPAQGQETISGWWRDPVTVWDSNRAAHEVPRASLPKSAAIVDTKDDLLLGFNDPATGKRLYVNRVDAIVTGPSPAAQPYVWQPKTGTCVMTAAAGIARGC